MIDCILECRSLRPNPLKDGALEAMLVGEDIVLFVTMPDVTRYFQVGKMHHVRIETVDKGGDHP